MPNEIFCYYIYFENYYSCIGIESKLPYALDIYGLWSFLSFTADIADQGTYPPNGSRSQLKSRLAHKLLRIYIKARSVCLCSLCVQVCGLFQVRELFT